MNNYMNYEWYRNKGTMTNSYTNNLFSPNEAFTKGNLFKNIYNPYKNYRPQQLTPTSEKEKKLYELSAIAFAAHELNLYLDLHPEDQSMFMLFSDYQKKANRLMEEYEAMYGPLTIGSEDMGKSFTWAQEEWPWEGTNV